MHSSHIALAALFSAALLAQPAYAYPYGGYGGHRGGGEVVVYGDPYYYGPPPVVYAAPPPVYYAAPPVVYAPQPAYPAPAYAQPAPQPVQPPPSAIQCTNEVNPFGVLLGAAAGGLIGSTVGHGAGHALATIGGAVAGGAVGASVSQVCSQAMFAQVPVGTPLYWQNAQLVPTRDYTAQGRYCREYQSTVNVGGQPSQTYGTACQQPDGTWQIMN